MNVSDDFRNAKADFDRNGFTVLKGFISPQETATIHENLTRYVNDIVPELTPAEVLYEDKDDPETMFRLEAMQKHDAYFRGLFLDARFVDLASHFLDDDIVPRGVELFGKARRIGNETPPHQDGYYFMLEPPTAMTFWIALDRADEENGCIRYINGSHSRGLRPHAMSEVLGFSQGIVDFGPDDLALEEAAVVEPGDVIAHHCMVVHRTDANRSDKLRRALGFVYFGQHASVNREAAEEYRKKLFAKWEDQGKI